MMNGWVSHGLKWLGRLTVIAAFAAAAVGLIVRSPMAQAFSRPGLPVEQTQQPFLGRWLLLTAALFGASVLIYAIRSAWARWSASRTPGRC